MLGPSGPALRSRLATGLTDGAVVHWLGKTAEAITDLRARALPLSLPVITELVAAYGEFLVTTSTQVGC